MIRKAFILAALASSALFSCNDAQKEADKLNEGKNDPGNIVKQADKIVFSFHPSSVAPVYYRGYTIAVTEDNLHLAINSYSDTLLTKNWTFTLQKFDGVKERLKDLKNKGAIDETQIPDGGTTDEISLYKGNNRIFHGEDFGATKNFKGAEVDLSYLIPDLEELIESTRTKSQAP